MVVPVAQAQVTLSTAAGFSGAIATDSICPTSTTVYALLCVEHSHTHLSLHVNKRAWIRLCLLCTVQRNQPE